VIEAFRADQAQVELGTEVTLETRFANGTGLVDNDGGPLPHSGPVKVTPIGTTTYTLTVTNAEGRAVQKQTTVEVKPGLAITVEGHEGQAGTVTVAGPDGYTRTLVASGILTGLPAGDYTVTAATAERDGAALHPRQPIQHVQVRTGTAVTVSYPAPTRTLSLPGGVTLDLVLIPAGTFNMGSDYPADPRIALKPSPAHPVSMAKAFYVAKYPTTQAQWQAVTGRNPSPKVDPSAPVRSVSYKAIHTEFLPELNGRVQGLTFRLPSEAEWEYSCRAGSTTTFFHGNDPAEIKNYAWTVQDYLQNKAHPVGEKRPNPWGLYDLTGMVFQWCEDLAHYDYAEAPKDGSPWLEGGGTAKPKWRVIRGYPPILNADGDPNAGSASRWSEYEDSVKDTLGFRLVATPASK
jgi:formylglycine-generating enzyme required for sulfatase activity